MSETNERRPRRDGAATTPSVPEHSDETRTPYKPANDAALNAFECRECAAHVKSVQRDYGQPGDLGVHATMLVWRVLCDSWPSASKSAATLSRLTHIDASSVRGCQRILTLAGVVIATHRPGRTTVYTFPPCPHMEPLVHARGVEIESAQGTERATERATTGATEGETVRAYTRLSESKRIEGNATCSRHGSDIDQPEPCRGCMEAKERRKMQQHDQRKADELRAAQSRLSPSELHAYQPERVDAYTESCAKCGRAASHAAHQPMPG